MAATFYERANSGNDTLGGVRLWVNELLDASSTPPKYGGTVDLGCIEEAPIEQAIEYQEHFCASTGTRVKDKKIVKQVSATITATLVEVDAENLRLFFLGGAITPVAEALAGGTVTDEVARCHYPVAVPAVGSYSDRRILQFGKNASTIVVTTWAGGPLVLATDYVIEDYYGFKAIRFIKQAVAGVVEGDYVKIDYKYDVLESRSFNPLTSFLKVAQVRFIGASDNGTEIFADFAKCNISPSGNFNWNNNDWTTFQLMIDILDNSAVAPTAPFGTIQVLGSGQNI